MPVGVCHLWKVYSRKAYKARQTSTIQKICETILRAKPFIAFLNRSSGIKRGQPHNTYNIIITDTKQRQHLCFFCVVVQPFRLQVPTLTMKRP